MESIFVGMAVLACPIGFDGTQGRLMVSSNFGNTWARRTPPAAMFGLAIDPRDPDRVVIATESGLYGAKDAGRDWRPLRRDLAGLLAWPAPRRLYLVDGAGQVALSADGGRKWRKTGTVGALPVAFKAEGRDIYAALGDGTVKRSADGGRTWSLRAMP